MTATEIKELGELNFRNIAAIFATDTKAGGVHVMSLSPNALRQIVEAVAEHLVGLLARGRHHRFKSNS